MLSLMLPMMGIMGILRALGMMSKKVANTILNLYDFYTCAVQEWNAGNAFC